MRIPRLVPPDWRPLAAGRVDPWMIAAAIAGVAGVGYLMSPTGAASKLREVRARRAGGVAPTATGRALGYASILQRSDPVRDPIEVLVRRAAVADAYPGRTAPVYRAHRVPEYVRTPRSMHLPIRGQRFTPLASLPGSLAPPPAGNPALTAADALALTAARQAQALERARPTRG